MLLGNKTLLQVPMVAVVSFAQYEIEHAPTQNCGNGGDGVSLDHHYTS